MTKTDLISDFQMIDEFSLVNRTLNTTAQYIGSDINDETAIAKCLDAVILANDNDVSNGFLYRMNTQIRSVFRSGYREELLALSDSFKNHMLQDYVSTSDINLGFGLLRLKSDSLPITFTFRKRESLQKFETKVSQYFSEHFSDLGSKAFIEKLHSYFYIHGSAEMLDPKASSDHNILFEGFDGRADYHMAYTALVLKDVYGEKKMTDFLERIITEMPPYNPTKVRQGADVEDPMKVRAVDMLRIVQSDIDFSETPLHWAAQIAREGD